MFQWMTYMNTVFVMVPFQWLNKLSTLLDNITWTNAGHAAELERFASVASLGGRLRMPFFSLNLTRLTRRKKKVNKLGSGSEPGTTDPSTEGEESATMADDNGNGEQPNEEDKLPNVVDKAEEIEETGSTNASDEQRWLWHS